MSEKSRDIHRDDLDMDLVNAIEEAFGEMFPGKKLVFAGDLPEGELPDEMKNFEKKLIDHYNDATCQGKCGDCGKQMKNWPPVGDNWDIDDNWSYIMDSKQELIINFICDECDN